MVNRQKLIEDNIKLVYYVVHRNFPKYISDEDLIQVGMMGLCQAANAWNEGQGTFSNFAVTCIYNAICVEFKTRNRQKLTYSLDYLYSDESEEALTLGDILVGDADIDWVDIDEIYKILKPNEKVIVDLKRIGLSQADIARKLGVTRQNVSKQLRLIKLRLEKMNEH